MATVPCVLHAAQATWYDAELKKVVPVRAVVRSDRKFVHITGVDVLSNEAVNLVSVVCTALFAGGLGVALTHN